MHYNLQERVALVGYISSSRRSEREERDNGGSRRSTVKIQLGVTEPHPRSGKYGRKQYDFVIFRKDLERTQPLAVPWGRTGFIVEFTAV